MEHSKNQEKCSCETLDTSLESDSSNSESLESTKERRSKISLFGKTLHFNKKRNKKTTQDLPNTSGTKCINLLLGVIF